MIVKNQAYTLPFFVGATGLTPVVTISKDGAAFASPAGTVAETGSGWYRVALTAADMNADTVALHIVVTPYTPLDLLVTTDIDLPAATWDRVLETGFPASRLLRTTAAAVAGKSSGGPAGFVARNLADTQDQVTGTADVTTGNRTSATYGT